MVKGEPRSGGHPQGHLMLPPTDEYNEGKPWRAEFDLCCMEGAIEGNTMNMTPNKLVSLLAHKELGKSKRLTFCHTWWSLKQVIYVHVKHVGEDTLFNGHPLAVEGSFGTPLVKFTSVPNLEGISIDDAVQGKFHQRFTLTHLAKFIFKWHSWYLYR